jgi:hypothetical protein
MECQLKDEESVRSYRRVSPRLQQRWTTPKHNHQVSSKRESEANNKVRSSILYCKVFMPASCTCRNQPAWPARTGREKQLTSELTIALYNPEESKRAVHFLSVLLLANVMYLTKVSNLTALANLEFMQFVTGKLSARKTCPFNLGSDMGIFNSK